MNIKPNKWSLLILLIFIVIVTIDSFRTKKNDRVYKENFERKEHYGKIKKIDMLDRGFLNLTFENGEQMYLGMYFNSNNCQLLVQDSVAKDSGTMKIKIYRNKRLIYTELNKYYDK